MKIEYGIDFFKKEKIFNNNHTNLLYFKFDSNNIFKNNYDMKKMLCKLLVFFNQKNIVLVYEPEVSFEIFVLLKNKINKNDYYSIVNKFNYNKIDEEYVSINSKLKNNRYKVVINSYDSVETVSEISKKQKYVNLEYEDYTKQIETIKTLTQEHIDNIASNFIHNSVLIRNYSTNININNDVYNIDDMYNIYKNITKESDLDFGHRYKHVNNVIKSSLLGDLIGIVAGQGVGKTTIIFDMINEYCKLRNVNGVIFSLEMAAEACFLRCATITLSDYRDVIVTDELKRDLEKEEYNKLVKEDWNKILFITKGSLSLEEMEEYIVELKNKYNIKIIGIDYAQYIKGASNISLARDIARNTKELLKSHKIYGLLAIQTGKTLPNIYTEIEDCHIEGVAAIKQSCDYILGLWKDAENKRVLHCKFLKSRWSSDLDSFILERKALKYTTKGGEDAVLY